jgi:hypothetical protein
MAQGESPELCLGSSPGTPRHHGWLLSYSHTSLDFPADRPQGDDTRPQCKHCQRLNKDCIRSSGKIKFRPGSSAKYDSSFGKHQTWLSQKRNGRCLLLRVSSHRQHPFTTDQRCLGRYTISLIWLLISSRYAHATTLLPTRLADRSSMQPNYSFSMKVPSWRTGSPTTHKTAAETHRSRQPMAVYRRTIQLPRDRLLPLQHAHYLPSPKWLQRPPLLLWTRHLRFPIEPLSHPQVMRIRKQLYLH